MTRQTYKKYGWAIVITALLLWSLLAPSPFQKGGVDTEFYFAIALLIGVLSILTTFLFDNVNLIERILVSVPFTLIALFVTTFFIGPEIVEYFYGDKTWLLWEIKHRLFINAVYYGLNVIILTILANIYFLLRRQVKEGKKLKSACS